MKKVKLYTAFLALLFVACERQEDVDMNVPFKRKLVAAVFIGAGDNEVLANINYTSPVFGAPSVIDFQSIPGVSGFVNNGVERFLFGYDTIDKQYKAFPTTPVMVGQTYEASFTDGNLQTKGKTTVPQPVSVDIAVQFDSILLSDFLPSYFANITCTLKSANPAYVKIVPFLVMDDSITSILMTTQQYAPISLLQPGQSFTAKYYAEVAINGLQPAKISCLIVSCDEAYAQYANATQSADYSSILPGSEPSMVYSNMSNNIGVIASYNICGNKDIPIK